MIQTILLQHMAISARELGTTAIIGIVSAVFSSFQPLDEADQYECDPCRPGDASRWRQHPSSPHARHRPALPLSHPALIFAEHIMLEFARLGEDIVLDHVDLGQITHLRFRSGLVFGAHQRDDLFARHNGLT